MELKEKFLPIGSVVLLKGGEQKIMITGFCSVADEDKTKMYDYSGCTYPEGYLSSNQVCLFDHNQIEQLFYLGYESDEEKEFKTVLNEIVSKYNSGEIDTSDDEEDDDTEELIEDLEYL